MSAELSKIINLQGSVSSLIKSDVATISVLDYVRKYLKIVPLILRHIIFHKYWLLMFKNKNHCKCLQTIILALNIKNMANIDKKAAKFNHNLLHKMLFVYWLGSKFDPLKPLKAPWYTLENLGERPRAASARFLTSLSSPSFIGGRSS
jgi:hypothetical protein